MHGVRHASGCLPAQPARFRTAHLTARQPDGGRLVLVECLVDDDAALNLALSVTCARRLRDALSQLITAAGDVDAAARN